MNKFVAYVGKHIRGARRVRHTVEQSTDGVLVMTTPRAQYTGWAGIVTVWSVPMDAHEDPTFVARYDGSTEAFLQVAQRHLARKPAITPVVPQVSGWGVLHAA